jgi:hypothetical protein
MWFSGDKVAMKFAKNISARNSFHVLRTERFPWFFSTPFFCSESKFNLVINDKNVVKAMPRAYIGSFEIRREFQSEKNQEEPSAFRMFNEFHAFSHNDPDYVNHDGRSWWQWIIIAAPFPFFDLTVSSDFGHGKL